jgi:hypothetical protein
MSDGERLLELFKRLAPNKEKKWAGWVEKLDEIGIDSPADIADMTPEDIGGLKDVPLKRVLETYANKPNAAGHNEQRSTMPQLLASNPASKIPPSAGGTASDARMKGPPVSTASWVHSCLPAESSATEPIENIEKQRSMPMRLGELEMNLPISGISRGVPPSHEAATAATAALRELDEIKVQTMYRLVEDLSQNNKSQRLETRKMLFLRNDQANAVRTETTPRILDALGIDDVVRRLIRIGSIKIANSFLARSVEPKHQELVIHLIPSHGEVFEQHIPRGSWIGSCSSPSSTRTN